MSVAQDDQLANGMTHQPDLRSAVAGSGMDGEGRCAARADKPKAKLIAWKPEASVGKPEKRGRGRPKCMAQHHLDESSRALSALNLLSQPVNAFTPVVTESGQRKAVSIVKTLRPRQSLADANAFLKTRPGLHDILKSRKSSKQSASLRSLRFDAFHTPVKGCDRLIIACRHTSIGREPRSAAASGHSDGVVRKLFAVGAVADEMLNEEHSRSESHTAQGSSAAAEILSGVATAAVDQIRAWAMEKLVFDQNLNPQNLNTRESRYRSAAMSVSEAHRLFEAASGTRLTEAAFTEYLTAVAVSKEAVAGGFCFTRHGLIRCCARLRTEDDAKCTAKQSSSGADSADSPATKGTNVASASAGARAIGHIPLNNVSGITKKKTKKKPWRPGRGGDTQRMPDKRTKASKNKKKADSVAVSAEHDEAKDDECDGDGNDAGSSSLLLLLQVASGREVSS